MKINLKPTILPWFTLGAGGLGLCLQICLFRRMDEQGLLPAKHFAGSLSFVLFALVLVVVFLCSRRLTPIHSYKLLFPADLPGAIGCAAGAVGFALAAFSQPISNILAILHLVIGIAAAACVLLAGYCRFTGRYPVFWYSIVITVFFMLHLILRCRQWGAQPQLQFYFFPFLGTVFLLLSAYQRACLDAGRGLRQWYVFFNQSALFCCLLAAAGENKLFFLTMAAWLGTNLCSLRTRPRRQIPHAEGE